MTRAQILWLANGPTLKMEGRLGGEWAEAARRLVTTDVVPKGLIVDLTGVSYVDSAGERLLSWLGSVGAVFAASTVYATAVCERLGLSPVRRIPARRNGCKEKNASITYSHAG
jgi:ABC-type transporter Mla MlaB component